MAEAKVLQIPEGSLLVLTDVRLGVETADGWDDSVGMASLIRQLVDMLGHNKFLVVSTFADGKVEVIGPDEDLRARLVELGVPTA